MTGRQISRVSSQAGMTLQGPCDNGAPAPSKLRPPAPWPSSQGSELLIRQFAQLKDFGFQRAEAFSWLPNHGFGNTLFFKGGEMPN